MNTTNLIIAGLAFLAGKSLSEGGAPAAPQAAQPQAAPVHRTIALDAALDDVTYRAVINCFQRATAPEQLEGFAAELARGNFPIASLMLQRRAQGMRQEQAKAQAAHVAPAAQAAPAAPAPAPKPHPNADVSLSLLKMLADLPVEAYELQARLWDPEQRREIEALMLSKGLNPPKAKPKPELAEAKPNGLAQELGSVLPQPVTAFHPTPTEIKS